MLAIDRLRDDLRAASARWVVGTNVFTKMTPIERRRHLGYHPGPDELSLKRREAVARLTRLHGDSVPPLRTSCDLRSRNGRNFVSAVGERTLASCARTISTVVETTVRVARENPLLQVSSPLLVVDRQPPVGRAWLNEPYKSLALAVRDVSIPTGDHDPLVTIRRWHELHTRSAMKQWLSTQGPLLAVHAVHEDLFAYASGIYHHISGPPDGGHCVAIIGYDDSDEYWIAQNTWGTAWGERGCFRISFGERGIDASMWGVELQ
jgi:hypothetical protein